MNKRTSVLRFLAFRKLRTSFLRMLLDGVLGRNEIRSREKRRYRFEALEERRVLATMYALDNANNVLTFDSATPGTISSNVAITGLFAGEQVVGIDTRPATGNVYALGLVDDGTTRTGRIYTLDPTSGVAVQVGGAPWSTTLTDTPNFGFNFNPNVDRIRIVNRDGGNFRVHPDTGALVATDTNLSSTGLNGVSYTNNDGLLSATTLFGLNFDDEELVTIGGLNGSPSPNGGVVNIIGDTGTVAFDSYGFEITAIGRTTTAFATADGDLYTVNLSTGAFTLAGAIGGGTGSYLGLTAALNTIAVAGSAADDTVVVTASGPSSGTYSLNGGPAVPFANIASFSFIGGAGSDTLTINNPAGGLFAPTAGIDYHGGGQPGDALNLLGGGNAAFNETYFVGTTTPPLGAGAGNNGDGLIRFTGPTPVDIRFTGLAPIVDTVAVASLTVNSTDAANTISVTNAGVAPRVRVAVDAFEPIDFDNKTLVVVNAGDGAAGGDGADNILVGFNFAPGGLTNITVNADEGADIVSVTSNSAASTLIINGGDGLDAVNIGNSGAIGAPGLLTPIAGAVTVNGGAGGANLVVDGSGAAVAADYAITSTTVTRSLPAGFGGVTYSNLSNLLLTVGSGANVISVTGTAAGVVTNIATGAGDDSIVFANGVSLNGGTVDGGANNDTLDYSAYSTGVSVNLGLSVSGLAATLSGDQEVPANASTPSGSASITNYNPTTRTFDISVTVNDLNPLSVTGFHIHRGAFGINGPVIVNFSAGPLVPAGTGFTFSAVGVSLNPLNFQDEAALLSGTTYLNVHTAAFPGGIIRGQLFSNGNVGLAGGRATGTGGVTGIENAIGGSAADGLVGTTGINSLLGNAGADVLLGGPGNDNMQGGNDNDILVWSNGDNTDVIDGNSGTDIVSVNGAVAAGDIFTVTGAGTRVNFARTNLVPFALDIGTVERLIVNGAGGDDSLTSSDMSGVVDLTTLDLNGQLGNDTFNPTFPASPALAVNVKGGPHNTGDILNIDAGGGPIADSGTQLSKLGAGPVNYLQIENMSIANIGDLTVAGSGLDDTLVVNATSANAGTYQLNAGLITAFTGITKLTFNSAAGNDTLTINNPVGSIFAPAGGIDYNGGGNAGDALNLLGGGNAGLNEIYFVGTTTPPIGVGPGNNGDGLVRFTGSQLLDLRFTGLAPIVDTVAAASLTVNATDGANIISVTNGGVAPRLRVAVDAFEPIDFDNKALLVVNAGDGVAGGDLADIVLLNFNNLPAGLTGITINADEGADTVSLQASSSVPVILNGGDGLDLINVGNNGTLGAPGLLTPVVGPVIVNGGVGGANLTVDGTGAGVAANYSITATTVTRSSPAGFGGVTYSNLSTLLLATGSGPNIVTVSSTSVPTTVDANSGIDTLILNPTNSISVYEQAGNYGFELGTPGGLTALDFENINLQPGNGVLNIAGDEGQGTNVGGAGVDEADLIDVLGTAQNTGVLRLAHAGVPIGIPPVVQFAGVTRLNINTFDLDDDVTIDPFANTTQNWNIVVSVDSGNGDDDIFYGNAAVIPVLDPIPNGSVAAVSEDVTVRPTLIPGSGEIAVPGVVTIHFQNTEDLSFLLNDGGLGDTDTLTIQGTDSNLSDSFTIRPDAAGNDAEPVVDLDISAVQILQIENVALVIPGGAQQFVTALNFEGLGGSDSFNLLPSASGTILNIDGGNPTNSLLPGDVIVIPAPVDPTNQVSINSGATADSGTVVTTLGGTPRAQVNFSRTEGITIENAGATIIGGSAIGNTITVVGTGASALTANVDSGPTLQFTNVVSLQIDAFASDDDVALTVGLLAIASITVTGGDPTASDTLLIVGTGGVDTVVFTATGFSSGSLTGLATPINFATTEHVIYDGNDLGAVDVVTINGTLTNDTLTYDANSLKGSFRSFASPDFDTIRSARIVTNGGGGGVDVVNLIGSAGVDTVTSAANAISINTTGTLAIITLGAGIDAVTISTLDNNDNVNLSGITVTSTVFGGDGNDTIVGSPQVDSIYGGAGNDTLVGGAGNDFEYGDEGNDIFGNLTLTPDGVADDAGADQAFGGEGFDNFVWEPGDGADFNNGGGDAADIFRFFGNAAANVFTLRQGGTPTHFNALIGALVIDNHGIEDVIVDGQGGADTFLVQDLFATEVVSINLNLGAADAAAIDPVTINGRNAADNLVVTSSGAGTLSVQGLRYNVNLSNAEVTDALTINGNDGDDQVTVAPGAEAVLTMTLNGNIGDDRLTGNVAFMNGADGNDTLIGGAGNQSMDGGAGDDTFAGNGGTDNIGGGAGSSVGDTILVAGTSGNDTIALSLSGTGQLVVTMNGLTTTYGNFIGGAIASSGIEQLLVQGFAGNDSLTVDSTNGAIPIVINFDGGNNADTLTLTGGIATSDTYAVGPNVDQGTSAIVIGGVTQIVRFNALEPVLDLVAGPLAVVATNADNAINYTQGNVAANGLVSIDGFETIEFSNKTTLAIDAMSGSDTINLNNPNTPTGLTGVTVNGGDQTGSDVVVVNGSTGANNVVIDTLTADGARITGLGPVINVATTEKLHYNGQEGGDTFTLTTPAGLDFIAATPTLNSGEGAVSITSGATGDVRIPISWEGVNGFTAAVVFADASATRSDTLTLLGTKLSDSFNSFGPAGNVQYGYNTTAGFLTLLSFIIQTPGVASLQMSGLDGDDTFSVSGNHPFVGGVLVDGGNPSANDVLNFTSAGAAATLNFGTASVVETGFAPVVYRGIEIVNANSNTANLTVNGSAGDDSLEVTPTGTNSATFRLTKTNPSIGSTPVFNAANIGTLNVDLLAGNDTLTVNGTTAGEAITVTGVLVTVGTMETVNFLGTEALSVFAQQGADTITVAPGVIPIFIDGGDPIGVLSGDQLVVNGAVGFFAGPENDEGGVITVGGTVSFDHIESLTVAAIIGCPFLILGTNADDDITVIARDASTTVGADGVQDFTFSVNLGLNVVVLNQADLFIDAMAGDDDIVIRTAAPNEAAWDVNVRVAGGSPSIGAPLEADRLVLETPNNAGGFDDIVFNPTGNDTGNLVIDENANGTYDAAGTDSLITFGSFVMVCPPANLTYTSTAGGVELIQVHGEGAPAIDDNLTINGTALGDTTAINPTGIGTGTFTSGASPQFIFQSFDNVTVNPGAGGFDHVEINGTAGPDTVTSTANTVTLGGTVTLGAGIDQLNINTFDGNDNVDLDLTLIGLKKVIDLGAGNDTANLLGVAVDPADPVIFGGDGDDNIIGSPNLDVIYGGSGDDVIIGGAGNDFLYGEDGNDIFGNPNLLSNGVADDPGVDSNFGGAGFDNFVWEPGDGPDINNGGEDAADIFRFFGDANANIFTLRTGGTPTHFNALFGAVNIDNHGIEDVVVSALGGADTIAIADLFPTEVVALNLNLGAADGAIDSVTLNGRALSDNLLISNPVAGSVLVAGLRYNVTVSNAEIADTLTVNGNDGDDRIAVASGANAVLALTLNGNDGNDILDASTTTTAGAIVFNGGAGRDTILGGFGDDQIAGGADEDSLVGGPGNDTFDGGTGFDTILVRGTLGNDIIDISQTADVTLLETVNGVVETDTLALVAGTRTVERVSVVADAGNDTIRIQWVDSLGTDANVNSLRVDVDGGAGSTGDRLGVVDLGIGDLILYERGTTNDSGAMAIGPGNAEPLIVSFSDIETAQPIAGVGGDVVVFKHDPFEFNNARTLATYLGAGETINVDPTINPGLDAAFGFPADEDWFRVVAEKTGVLDFQVYFRQVATVGSGRPGLPNAGNLDIAVTDAAGNVIAGFGNNDNSNDERIRIPAVAAQTYYLRVFANGSALNTYNITVDNYAPPVPRDMELLDNPVGDLANSDTGRSQSDNITRDNTPTLVFRLDDGILLSDLPGNSGAGAPPDEVIPIGFQPASGTAGYRIAIFDEGNSPLPGNQTGTAPQTPIGFATFVSAGIYQFTTPLLTDGSHFLTARVQMVDPATPQQTGFGDRSVALEVIVDTVVPPAFFGNSTSSTDGLHRDSDSGIATVIASFADRITNDTTPSMYGSAEANAIIRLFVDRTNNGFTADDILLGQTVARPLDGTNQALGEWDITATTSLNSPDIVAAIGKDGVRNLYITAEDVAGNVSTAVSLSIMLDTTPVIITAVTLPNGDSVFQVKPTPTPTPRVDFMTVTFTGGPASSGGFALLATDPSLAANVRNYQLVGDHNGNILISNAAVISQSGTTVVVRLNFSRPLPDDRFTLTLDDSIADAANNALDGESQSQSPGLAGSVLPSGNGISGGDFKARFTVDSRPEVGVVSEGIVYVDINGNYLWDPQGINNDSTNRDLVFQFGQLVDAHFAGNFAPVGAVAASGYDKLGAYGKFAGTYSFVLDTNDDGVADFSSLMPAAYQVNGIPVAGNFNAAHPGDEIGLFDGAFWYVDTNGDNKIDLGERIASNFNGLPIVGDFDGNGTDDFAAFNNSTNTFTFDTNRDGNADFTWRVADDVQRFVGLSGFTDRPVAGDLNLDGIDDIGLWVKDRQGTLPRDSGEYFFWVSDRTDLNPANVFDSYSPDPLGNDLFAEFGDELGLPIFGNFDPPVVGSGDLSNPLHNTPSPLDVDSDGFVSPLDVLVVVNVLNQFPAFPSSDPVRTFYTIGQKKADPNNDRTVNPLDVLTIINYLNSRPSNGSGEGEGKGSATDTTPKDTSSIDAVFSQLGLDIAEEVITKKRRR